MTSARSVRATSTVHPVVAARGYPPEAIDTDDGSVEAWPGDGGAPRRSSAPAAPRRPRSAAVADASLAVRTVRLFGLELCDTTRDLAARWLVDQAVRGEPARISFVNAHCVNVMYRDAEYRRALQGSDRIFVDGSGMMLAARSAGIQLSENLNGTDLFPVLCRHAAAAGASVFLFGGRDGVAREAGERMTADVPGLKIAGALQGYFSSPEQEEAVIRAINASKAGIVMIGLGVPAQEIWIARNRHRLEAPVLIGCGGLFDYFSGRIPRAPLGLRKLGVEWAWRMAMEPRRLAGRYVVGNAEFLLRLAQLRLVAPHEFGPQRMM